MCIRVGVLSSWSFKIMILWDVLSGVLTVRASDYIATIIG